MKRVVIDLDGTICEQSAGGDAYFTASPRQHVIDKVNDLWCRGWTIIIHTARGMRELKGDIQAVESKYRDGTERWLIKHNVKYHFLAFGKFPADLYVDDKGMSPDEFTKIPL